MKKISVVSIVALSVAHAAFAEGFPGNGYMLENKTYDNAATYANMGVYSDSVDATADYTNNEYTVNAGQYLPAASETVTECPANSFCPGLTGPTYYDADNAQGATACSTLSGGYNSSDAGASAETDCYKACTTSNVAHSTAVSGNDYYGAGVDTCSATGCENGYHTHATTLNDTIDLYSIIESVHGDKQGRGSTGLTESGTFDVLYSGNTWAGLKITGHAQCSSQSGLAFYGGRTGVSASTAEEITKSATLPDSTGQYCYCTVDSYTPDGGTKQDVSSLWVLYSSTTCSTDNCAYSCAQALADLGLSTTIFREATLGALSIQNNVCEANTINITWSDASADDIAANNAGTCTYGGDIRTPAAAAVKPGKTFVGWKFQKPSGD